MSVSSDARSLEVEKDINLDEKKHRHRLVSADEVDTGAAVVYGEQHGELDPAEALRVRRKIDRHIIPLMCRCSADQNVAVVYWIQFMDKTTLNGGSILGLNEATHLTTNHYSARYNCVNILVWGVALACHAACKNFRDLAIARVVLGWCEGFLIETSMFYTRREQTLRVGYWSLMSGVSLAVAHDHHWYPHSHHRGSILVDNTRLAHDCLVSHGRGARCRCNAIEVASGKPNWSGEQAFQKGAVRVGGPLYLHNHFNLAHKMIEALLDPKTWLFALFSGLANVPKSLSLYNMKLESTVPLTKC
ncbi:hypothetical protein B0H19DRAFT_1064269 [Mycena capillaripes]|nr:hypothetical protein B0H19DRAFT_1064269 [Mycena capillaripes]